MKYIFYVYKIITSTDPIKIYIVGSSVRKILDTDNKHYRKWSRLLKKSSISQKIIKSYPVENKEEEEVKTRYWISKYKKYGYEVSSSLQEKEEEKYKVYVCLENVTITEVVSLFGNKIISISKENNYIENKKIIKPPKAPVIRREIKKREVKENSSSGGYLDELKNVLDKRNGNSSIKIQDLVKKRKTPKKLNLPANGLYDNFIDELKSRMKLDD